MEQLKEKKQSLTSIHCDLYTTHTFWDIFSTLTCVFYHVQNWIEDWKMIVLLCDKNKGSLVLFKEYLHPSSVPKLVNHVVGTLHFANFFDFLQRINKE